MKNVSFNIVHEKKLNGIIYIYIKFMGYYSLNTTMMRLVKIYKYMKTITNRQFKPNFIFSKNASIHTRYVTNIIFSM